MSSPSIFILFGMRNNFFISGYTFKNAFDGSEHIILYIESIFAFNISHEKLKLLKFISFEN